MSKARNEKKRETILPMMIPGSYAAFSKKLFNKKSDDCGEFPHKHRIFYSFFSWLFRQAFLKSVMPPALRPKGLAEYPVLWKKRALSKENRLPLP